jgi:hypothetical protein
MAASRSVVCWRPGDETDIRDSQADDPEASTTHALGDTLRGRLERAKQLMVSTTGKRVSTSAIAKQLLDSAREDRLEVIDLLAHPTDSLLQIPRKGDARQLLSRAEWSVLAHFVRHGIEAFSSRTPNPVSRDSLVALLDAFLAVYGFSLASQGGDSPIPILAPSKSRSILSGVVGIKIDMET